ncbi:hypothetical protein HELRODRAFT_90869 [Helobdella robusta]|uniref:Sacsin/Nov domain-containing protein n=1 Tax=Helobdella robusta TaxID=6412 RepID=T1G7X2_HELRO|nr:hypothetical protein HELRODRAFT_90869 [Helobdella robusta]ESN90221.1 hypothetical protein HELRODRAFT_90869 [Helobdella robusta]
MSPTNAGHESITQENLNYHDASYWRGIVDEIRRNEFGIGVALDGEGRVLMKKQLDRQGRCLDRLSKDLYSKDTHFVLELVQNADDNSYSSENCTPSLRFILNQDSIVVLNNEVGFNELNFRAICDVGRTTKGKHMLGYIGQKGIGFKSVFRVSDTPEVHSRGLHVKFDANSKPLGYILPEWTGDGVDGGDEENRKLAFSCFFFFFYKHLSFISNYKSIIS